MHWGTIEEFNWIGRFVMRECKMKIYFWFVLAVACLLAPALSRIHSSVWAQTGAGEVATGGEIPEAALLTDRGTELAQQLRLLRWSEARMGPKHPALPDVRQQIADVEELLKAWQIAPNPFRLSDITEPDQLLAGNATDMNERDLQQIVLILAKEVQDLNHRLSLVNRRVNQLERQAAQ